MTSCDEEANLNQPELDLNQYSLLKATLSSDLNYLASELRNYSPKEKPTAVIEIVGNYYGKNSKQFDVFNQSVDLLHQPFTDGVAKQVALTSFQKNEVEKIIAAAENFSNFSEYKEYLNSEFARYANSDLSIEDKNFMLTFIASFEVSFEVISLNPDLFLTVVSSGRVQGFWGCVAGIAGAVAVTTAVVGALVSPPLWVLGASGWSLVASAGALSAVTIATECGNSK